MKKTLLLCIVIMTLMLGACTPIVSDDASQGDYATQNKVSVLEYSMFMNKQITVFTTQLTSHMSLIANEGCCYENIIPVTEETIRVLKADLDEVIVTYPPVSYEDARETTITVMQTAIEHMESYLQTMKDSKPVSEYVDIFQTDFHALTAQANLYYQ